MQKSKYIIFLSMFMVYALTMGLYYKQTHNIIIQETEKNIEGTLLSLRALSHLISDLQKKEVWELQDKGILDKDYFSPALLSSSFITVQLNKYANEERKKLGQEPLLYKYASANPTNLNNLADAYELKLFDKFNNNKLIKYKEIIKEGDNTYLYYAISGKRFYPKCLQCHGDPKDAPASMIRQYGDIHGFGFKEGDLSSIISIKAPLNDIYKNNDKEFLIICSIIFLVFVLLFFIAQKLSDFLVKKEEALKSADAHKEKSLLKANALESSIQKLYTHVLSSKFNAAGEIIEVSEALCALSGYTQEEILGRKFCMFQDPSNKEDYTISILKSLSEGKQWVGEVKNIKKNGEIFWIEAVISPIQNSQGISKGYESIMRVITEKKLLQEDINIDPLTSLLNRRSFESHFIMEQARAKRDNKYLALIMIDIDFFKQYNDYYGHLSGDLALEKVAQSLQDNFRRSCDFVFRLGGEEFAVITSHESQESLLNSAINARKALHQEHIMHIKSDVDPYLTISVGIAIIYKDSKLDFKEIYKASDDALYEAKDTGRNKVISVSL